MLFNLLPKSYHKNLHRSIPLDFPNLNMGKKKWVRKFVLTNEGIIELIKYKDKTKEVLKSVVESSKKHLEAIFSKITGKSLGEVQKERTEALKVQKERERSKRQK
jgi:hypothetical protein